LFDYVWCCTLVTATQTWESGAATLGDRHRRSQPPFFIWNGMIPFQEPAKYNPTHKPAISQNAAREFAGLNFDFSLI
jgi:hypothetical protein